MIEVISINDSRWDSLVHSFSNYDVYYLRGYVKPFQVNGDGIPELVYYSSVKMRGLCVLMKREIPGTDYYDLITPYGYGGFIFDGDYSDLGSFFDEYRELLLSNNVVSVFYRFHPQLYNASLLKDFVNVVDLGKTIEVDLTSESAIWDNLTSKNRNVIRKAIKSGIIIEHCKDRTLLKEFTKVYNATMERDHAEGYYYFPEKFYDELYNSLDHNYEIFYAKLGSKIISIAIILHSNNRLHYHLSGSVFEYRSLAPSNLLLYEVSLWGLNIDCKTFHLGGGIGSENDNLFKFKQAFNRNCSGLQFSIGKQIINKKVYKQLVADRLNKDITFNMDSNFFPLYRC